MPYSQSWVRDQLKMLAYKKNIVDENGKYFTLHRISFAIRMPLNC